MSYNDGIVERLAVVPLFFPVIPCRNISAIYFISNTQTASFVHARIHAPQMRASQARAQTPDLLLLIKSIISRGCRRYGNKAKY